MSPLLPPFEESAAQSEEFGDGFDQLLLRQTGQAVTDSVDLPEVPEDSRDQGDYESPFEKVAVAGQEIKEFHPWRQAVEGGVVDPVIEDGPEKEDAREKVRLPSPTLPEAKGHP